jgi:hypothetical protein
MSIQNELVKLFSACDNQEANELGSALSQLRACLSRAIGAAKVIRKNLERTGLTDVKGLSGIVGRIIGTDDKLVILSHKWEKDVEDARDKSRKLSDSDKPIATVAPKVPKYAYRAHVNGEDLSGDFDDGALERLWKLVSAVRVGSSGSLETAKTFTELVPHGTRGEQCSELRLERIGPDGERKSRRVEFHNAEDFITGTKHTGFIRHADEPKPVSVRVFRTDEPKLTADNPAEAAARQSAAAPSPMPEPAAPPAPEAPPVVLEREPEPFPQPGYVPPAPPVAPPTEFDNPVPLSALDTMTVGGATVPVAPAKKPRKTKA